MLVLYAIAIKAVTNSIQKISKWQQIVNKCLLNLKLSANDNRINGRSLVEFSLTTYEFLAVVAAIAGFLSALTGSSGIVILPALLYTGLPPHLALGTSKLFTTTSLFTAALCYIRKGLFKPRYWVATTVATIVGAVIGVLLTQLFSNAALRQLLPLFIAGIAVYLIFPCRFKSEKAISRNFLQSPLTVSIGSFFGVYSGFIGAGTGAIWISFCTGFFKAETVEANALAQYMCFVTNLVALLVFIGLGQVHFTAGVLMAGCGALGAFLGSKTAIQGGSQMIKHTLIAMTLLMSGNLAVTNWFSG